MKIHIFSFIGDGGSEYKSRVAEMKKNNVVICDLCNTPEEHVVQDMLNSEKIYIVGDYHNFSEDVWDCIALANVCGKYMFSLDNLPVSELNKHTVDFLRRMADGLESAYNLGKIMGVLD